jgi:hypothetical protein
VTPGFLSELSVAMRSVVGRERDRIAAIVKDDAAAHVAQANEQSAAEAEAFQRVADEDVAAIEAWADQEVERIREEAARKIADRQADLEAYLGQHAAVLEGELEGIETAVGAYEAKVTAFLDELDATDDPAVIAERAHGLPRPPDLETVRSLARAETLTRLAEASMANDPAVEDAVAESDGDDAVVESAIGTDDAVEDADAVEAAVPGAEEAVTAAVGYGAPRAGDGWDSPSADAMTTDPVDIGLGAMVDEAATDRPVAVMDPEATGPAAATWPTDDVPRLTPVGAGQDDAPGHPNAAVRLIRSVAPWTAPHHDGDDRPTQPG